MATSVVAQSKPQAVASLRSTWRGTTQHMVEQITRFLRLTLLSSIPAISSLIAGGKFDYKTLLAFVLPFAEVAFRQVFPALGASGADQAPGVTIVPEQVGLPPVDPTPAAPVAPTDPSVMTDVSEGGGPADAPTPADVAPVPDPAPAPLKATRPRRPRA